MRRWQMAFVGEWGSGAGKTYDDSGGGGGDKRRHVRGLSETFARTTLCYFSITWFQRVTFFPSIKNHKAVFRPISVMDIGHGVTACIYLFVRRKAGVVVRLRDTRRYKCKKNRFWNYKDLFIFRLREKRFIDFMMIFIYLCLFSSVYKFYWSIVSTWKYYLK